MQSTTTTAPEQAHETEEPEVTLSSPLEAAIEAIVEFAHEAPTISVFYRKCLPVFASCLRATYLELEHRHAGTVVSEAYSDERTPADFWQAVAQNALTDALAEPGTRYRIFAGRNVKLSIALFTAPIGLPGRRGGAIIAVVPLSSREELETLVLDLDVLCSLTSSLVDAVGATSAAVPSGEEEVTRIRKVSGFRSEVEMAFAITNKLRTKDGAVRVALGSFRAGTVQLLSISGLDEIAPRSPGIKNIRFAMQECADMRLPLVSQDGNIDGVHGGGRLQRQWRESVGDAAVACLPLFSEGELVAVLAIQRRAKAPFAVEDLDEFRAQVEPYAAGLEMVRVARRSLWGHLCTSLISNARSLVEPGAWGRKALAGALALCMLWSFWGSVDFSVTAPCTLSPSSGRQVAAAFDGVLVSSPLKPGARVNAGTVLCKFDTAELDLEAARLRGELAMLEVDIYRSLGEGSAADAEYARVNSQATRASLNLVLHKIEQATVTAPVAGVLIEGDHSDRIGDTITKGTPLFRIAASADWKLEIQVSERDIDEIEAGATGTFASHSRPGEPHDFVISQISPMAESKEGQNIFVVEAQCQLPGDWIRSGMEGFASIEAGGRAPAWIAGHRLVDFLRLHLWL